MNIKFDPDEFFTAIDLIAKIAENDGHGSGLDADLLDGQHGSYYLPSGSYTAADVLAKLLTVHGPGSGLNADLLDGVHIAQILAQGIDIPGSANLNNYIITGLYHQNSNTNAASGSNYPVANAGMLEVVQDGDMVYQKYTVYNSSHNVYVRTYYAGTWYSWYRLLDQNDLSTINSNLALKLDASAYTASDILTKLKTVDGSGSGLDADTLDGVQYSAINSAITAKLNESAYTASDILTKLKTVDGANSGLDADLLDGQQGSYYLPASSYNAADVLTKLKTVDGSGSGLDADLLDGANPTSTGGTANAIVKARSNGTIDNDFLPFSAKSGTFRIPKLIERRTIPSGSPVSYVTFSGLNGDTDGEYILKYDVYKNGSSDRTLHLEFNNDTAYNYSSQVVGYVDNGASPISDGLSLSQQVLRVGQTRWDSPQYVEGKIEINAKTGKPRKVNARCTFVLDQGHSGFDYSRGHWHNTSSNVTSLTLRINAANSYYGTVELCKLVDLVIS